MRTHAVDRLTGAVLILIAAVWCWAVLTTVPAADEPGRLGPRGFPLGLGVLLGVLGVLLASSTLRSGSDPEDGESEAAPRLSRAVEVYAVASTLVLIFAYTQAMEQVGFLLATAGTIVVALTLVLGVWRPLLVGGLSLGLSLGIYLVFGKLLGVYLPHGRLIDLTF